MVTELTFQLSPVYLNALAFLCKLAGEPTWYEIIFRVYIDKTRSDPVSPIPQFRIFILQNHKAVYIHSSQSCILSRFTVTPHKTRQLVSLAPLHRDNPHANGPKTEDPRS